MKEYVYFQTQRYEQFAAMLRIGSERFEQVDDDPFRISVAPSGLCINGKYGSNPSKEEMREVLELMREAVAEWDKKYGSSVNADELRSMLARGYALHDLSEEEAANAEHPYRIFNNGYYIGYTTVDVLKELELWPTRPGWYDAKLKAWGHHGDKRP